MGEPAGLAAPCCLRLMTSSMHQLLEPWEDLLPCPHYISREINFGPGQVADILVTEAIGMREDEIADGGLILRTGASGLNICRRALGERRGHAGREAEEADRFAMPVVCARRQLGEINNDLATQADLH